MLQPHQEFFYRIRIQEHTSIAYQEFINQFGDCRSLLWLRKCCHNDCDSYMILQLEYGGAGTISLFSIFGGTSRHNHVRILAHKRAHHWYSTSPSPPNHQAIIQKNPSFSRCGNGPSGCQCGQLTVAFRNSLLQSSELMFDC